MLLDYFLHRVSIKFTNKTLNLTNLLHLIRYGFRAVNIQRHIAAHKKRRLVDFLKFITDTILVSNVSSYRKWIDCYESFDVQSINAMKAEIDAFLHKPKISVLMPVYNVSLDYLKEAIESVQNQIYHNWELCIADDASTDLSIRPLLESYAKKDGRIKLSFRSENGHISKASNSALSMATGDFVALLDNDDVLSFHALYHVAKIIINNPNASLIYSDEDKICKFGCCRHSPYFKSDWNPDFQLSQNMFSHLGVYRRSLLNEVGGFRVGFEGSQDYDLLLRCVEKIEAKNIFHIPHILYHWRVHNQSTALNSDSKPYAMLAGERAINDHFHRLKVKARAELIGFGYRVHYELPDTLPLVSIIIPTRNGYKNITRCIKSILNKTTYANYTITVVDNGSNDPELLNYFESLKGDSRITIKVDPRPFNYSQLNNSAVENSQGDLIALLNDDVEVISKGWLSEMVAHALREGVGAVGAKLLFPENTIQHAGIILGLGEDRVAGHPHYKMPDQYKGYFGRASLTHSLSAVTAACLVVKKATYIEIGGFDEANLAVAFNDVDFCLRLKKAGYRNVLTPFAELYHFESASRGSDTNTCNKDRFKKEVQYMKKTWGDELILDPFYNPNLSLDTPNFDLAFPPRLS